MEISFSGSEPTEHLIGLKGRISRIKMFRNNTTSVWEIKAGVKAIARRNSSGRVGGVCGRDGGGVRKKYKASVTVTNEF